MKVWIRNAQESLLKGKSYSSQSSVQQFKVFEYCCCPPVNKKTRLGHLHAIYHIIFRYRWVFKPLPHLCQIFNRSLTTAEVPQDFRSADVCPIPKKGLLTDTGNYRPISLTSVPGKVLESIIKDRVVNFLETNNLINTSQHGFRQGRSCVTNLLDFYHYVFCECDRSRAGGCSLFGLPQSLR